MSKFDATPNPQGGLTESDKKVREAFKDALIRKIATIFHTTSCIEEALEAIDATPILPTDDPLVLKAVKWAAIAAVVTMNDVAATGGAQIYQDIQKEINRQALNNRVKNGETSDAAAAMALAILAHLGGRNYRC